MIILLIILLAIIIIILLLLSLSLSLSLLLSFYYKIVIITIIRTAIPLVAFRCDRCDAALCMHTHLMLIRFSVAALALDGISSEGSDVDGRGAHSDADSWELSVHSDASSDDR